MTFLVDEPFSWFLEQFGDPQESQKASAETVKKYTGKLPPQLLSYWQEYGFCRFKDGLFFIVNPDNYQNAMEQWLSGTDIMAEDRYHVIARSGFGDLFLWGERNGNNYIIEPKDAEIYPKKGDDARIAKGLQDEAIQGFFATKSPKRIDFEDIDTGKLIFAEASRQFGALAEDEMFTFEPALFLGGEQTLKTLNKVNVHIQLELLAEMGQRQVIDINGLAKKAFS